MISSPQDIPILAVLAMSLSMYVVGMVCICCEPKCPYCPSSVKCIQVTISGCVGENGELPCDSCGRLNGTFILYRGEAYENYPAIGSPFSPCVYEAYLPPCFKTEGVHSYARYIRLNITSPTTATFRRGGELHNTQKGNLVVEVTNLDCDTLSGSGTATKSASSNCGGSISFNEIEQPCQVQTENENTEPCCCYVQGVSQVSVTISGWISGGAKCNCDFGVPVSHTANCSALNGTWVADLITGNAYTNDYGYVNSYTNCEEEDQPPDHIRERCLPTRCDAWGLSDIYGIPGTPPFAYSIVGCALGSVCSCPDNPYTAVFHGPRHGDISMGPHSIISQEIWGSGVPNYQNNYGNYGSQIQLEIQMGAYYGGLPGGEYCKFEPLEWPTERTVTRYVGYNYNNAYALCDGRSVTAEVVFT